MSRRYFTAEEANEALERVRPLAESMVVHRRALAPVLARQARFAEAIASNGGGLDPRELAEVNAAVEREAEAVARAVAAIEEIGGLVKDLDRGLVDFPALREGEEVLLCWQVGESRIDHWHGLEEGFAGRRPLSPGY